MRWGLIISARLWREGGHGAARGAVLPRTVHRSGAELNSLTAAWRLPWCRVAC